MEKQKKVTFLTVDEYIASQPEERRAVLEQIRQIIKKAAPLAEEVISYQMPAFRLHGMLAFYAAYKKHYGLYVPKVLDAFKEKLAGYVVSKATLQLPAGEPLPKKLIREIILYGAAANLERASIKKLVKGKKTSNSLKIATASKAVKNK